MKQIQSFFLGIFASLGALILEIIILSIFPISISTADLSSKITSIGWFFFLAIFIEEISKFLFILKFIANKENGRISVFNSLLFGLGFSMLEMILVYWNYTTGTLFDLIGISGILLVHLSTAALIGYSITRNSSKAYALLFGFIPALFLHTAYNILKTSQISNQKEITLILLAILIFVDIFLIIKSKSEPLQ